MFECQKRLLHYPSINTRASMLPRSLFLYIECSTVNGTLGVYEIVDIRSFGKLAYLPNEYRYKIVF